MNRRKFIKKSTVVCAGSLIVPACIQSCTSLQFLQNNQINGTIDGSDLVIPIDSFNNNGVKKLSIIVQHEILKYPICVYRFSDSEYTALYLACTHQGNELQVFGERLECPAHGSEFNNKGQLLKGPADKNLRSFPVNVTANELRISLKAQPTL